MFALNGSRLKRDARLSKQRGEMQADSADQISRECHADDVIERRVVACALVVSIGLGQATHAGRNREDQVSQYVGDIEDSSGSGLHQTV